MKATNKELLDVNLKEIARDMLGIETLETRDSDSLDFHGISVWSLRAALQAAYELGRSSK
jgi:hypothetical protein